MPNVERIIKNHNNRLTNEKDRPDQRREEDMKDCNCRNKQDCPMDGNCLTESVVYQAVVKNNKKWQHQNLHRSNWRDIQTTILRAYIIIQARETGEKYRTFKIYMAKEKSKWKIFHRMVRPTSSTCLQQHYEEVRFMPHRKANDQ